MSWREIQLGDGINVKHGFAFKGEFFASVGECIVVTPGNFLERGGFRVRDGKERFYLGDIPEDYMLAKDDLIVAMTEQGEGLLGSAARVPDDGRFLHNQRIGLVQVMDSDLLDKRFLYWAFNSSNVRAQIRGSATGAKVKHTAPERIRKVRLAVPDVPVQRAIASVLDAYDDLIATNQRRIQLLEDAARRLYREWFVHLRFPGNESVPVRNGVPKGWVDQTFGDVVNAVGGGTPSTSRSEYWNGEIVWVTPTDVTRNNCLVLLDSEKKITEAGLNNSSAKLIPAETILMTSRASIGYFALMDMPVCTNQGFISILPRIGDSRMFLLFNLLARVEEMKALATGSTFKELSKKSFKALPILWPSHSVLVAFEEAVYPLIQQTRLIKRQSEQLRLARDLLLPKLMSGQLGVSRIVLPAWSSDAAINLLAKTNLKG